MVSDVAASCISVCVVSGAGRQVDESTYFPVPETMHTLIRDAATSLIIMKHS
jgi:hypothetical protein